MGRFHTRFCVSVTLPQDAKYESLVQLRSDQVGRAGVSEFEVDVDVDVEDVVAGKGEGT